MNLVIGASGKLGSRITVRLLQNGKDVKAVSRNPEKLTTLQSNGAGIIRGDLRDPSWMDEALRGVQNLFIASQGLFPPSRKNNMYTVDDTGNRNLIDAAKRAGAECVFFTSVYFAKPGAAARFGRIKYKIEQNIKESGLQYTIVRPGAFIETHAIELIAAPLRKTGKVKFFGQARTPLRWISVEDAADYVVSLVNGQNARNAVKVIGGPDVLSRTEALEVIEWLLGKKAKRSHLPVTVMRLIKAVAKPLNPGLSYLIDTALAEEDPANDEEWTPTELDWTGRRKVDDVVHRWLNNKK